MFRRQASKTKKLANDSSKELFLTLSEEAKSAIRGSLLQALAAEQHHPTRNKIGDAVAEIAREYTDNGMSSTMMGLVLC